MGVSRWMLAVVGVRVVAGCVGGDSPNIPPASNATSNDAGESTSDSGVGQGSLDGATGTGDATVARCAPTDPWGAPSLVGVINQPGVVVSGARLSADEKTIYYSRRTPPSVGPVPIDELFFAGRAQPGQPFSASNALLTDPNYNKRATNPIVTADEKTLFFNTTGIAPGSMNVSIATRNDPATLFNQAGQVTFVAGPSDSQYPYINKELSRLYYSTNGSIFVATKQGSSFQDIAVLLKGNGSPDYASPVLSADELTIWFAHIQNNETKIHMSRRASLEEAFPLPTTEVEALNVNLPARPSWISDDTCEMYLTAQYKMSATVDAGIPEMHIFRATRASK